MSDVIATAIIPTESLQDFINKQLALVDEAKWHWDDQGIHVKAMDPGTVAMITADLETPAFESYNSPGQAVVGVNLNRLDDHLDVANSGDLAELSLDMEKGNLEIQIRHINQSLALIDPSAIRQEPDLPEIQEHMTTNATFTYSGLKEAVDAVDLVTDHVIFDSSESEKRIQIRGSGDTDDVTVEFDRDTEELVDASVADDGVTYLSLEYTTSVMGALESGEVRLEHGSEYPVQFYQTSAGGYLDVHYLISPRIIED